MADRNALSMAGLYRVLQMIADELDRDAPILQALAFLRVAMAGEQGVDHGQMLNELKASSAAMSRTVQALSATHYMKDREGFGLVERVVNTSDNRLRYVRLTPKGEKAVAKLAAAINKL